MMRTVSRHDWGMAKQWMSQHPVATLLVGCFAMGVAAYLAMEPASPVRRLLGALVFGGLGFYLIWQAAIALGRRE